MSVLINMEMPTEEYGSMTITIYPNGSVMEYIGDMGRSLGYAVPVPPHGRLIDADKMKESVRKQSSFLKLMGGDLEKIAETLEKGFLQEIANAPTIIPAEPPKEEA